MSADLLLQENKKIEALYIGIDSLYDKISEHEEKIQQLNGEIDDNRTSIGEEHYRIITDYFGLSIAPNLEFSITSEIKQHVQDNLSWDTSNVPRRWQVGIKGKTTDNINFYVEGSGFDFTHGAGSGYYIYCKLKTGGIVGAHLPVGLIVQAMKETEEL